MRRSIVAIVVGFVVIAALSIGTDLLVRSAVPGAFDAVAGSYGMPWLIASIVYVGIYAVAGCYLTARLAPDRPMRHAMILGVLGLLFSIAGTAANWEQAPAWYNVVMLATVLPYAWLGGRLRERELERRSAAPALAT